MQIELEKDMIFGELQSIRKMIKKFKQTEEQSNKKIETLQSNLTLARDEKNAMKQAFEIRLNTLIRAFVRTFDKLVENFKNYKVVAQKEIDCMEVMVKVKDTKIKEQQDSVDEYELALRIPRIHYKHLEKLRYAEIMEQRDEIIARLKRRYGIDPTKATALLKMPDPTLPPEK